MFTEPFAAPLTNEPFREDDGSYTELNNMNFRNPNFGRQDSLSIASELQQKDKERNQNSFMEADVNIENYLKELREDDYDDPIHEDPELAKTAFAMEQSAVYDSVQHGMNDEVDDFLNIMDTAPPLHPKAADYKQMNIKSEAVWEDEQPSTSTAVVRPARANRGLLPERFQETKPMVGATASPEQQHASRPSASVSPAGSYTPQTKARKYQLKAREEKENPVYKMKRMRNNDAVRRSRMKAKEQQEQRDKELQALKDALTRAENENRKLSQELNVFKRNCKCRK